MSEQPVDHAPAVESQEPASLEDTMFEAISEAGLSEKEDSFSDTEPDTPAAAPAAAPAEEPAEDAAEKPVQANEDNLEQELGPETDKRGRENRIPYSRVKQIVENARVKATEPLTAQVKDYEQRLEQIGQIEDLMVSNPRQFLDTLSARVPGYREILQPAQQAQQPEIEHPSYHTQDGAPLYTTDQIQRLLQRQSQELEQRIEQKFAPITQDYEAQQRIQAAIPRVQAQFDEAKTWPGFTDHQDAILAALRADKALTLHGAYMKAVLPKLQADRNKIREEVLRELKGLPRSTTVTATAARQDNTEEDLESRMLRAMKDSGL